MPEPAARQGDSPFFPGTSLQFAWDSTSLNLLQECPLKYKQVVIDGYRPKGSSVHLLFGGWFASALERYHKLRAESATHLFALERVVDWLLTETWIDGKPWESGHSKKTRETLLRSVIWYLDQYENDPVQTIILPDGRPAVELSFRFETDIESPYGRYVLCGHLDRMVSFGEEKFVQDQKTTGSTLGPYFFSEFNPHTQMSLYTLASRVVFNTLVQGVMIDGVQIAVGFTAFARSFTMRSEDQLEEWLNNVRYWLRLAESFAESGHYPRNEASCHKYGGCQFRDICSKSPSVRQQFLETEFERNDPWNPLKER